MPHDENQKLPPMVNIEQYYIEQFLLDAAEQRSDLIDIRWQTQRDQDRRTGGRCHAPPVHARRATTRCTPTGWSACDGGRSRVREALGLQLQGTSYEGRYVIVDIELKSDRPTERLAWFDPPSNPGSTVLCTSSRTTSGASTTSCATTRTRKRRSSRRT